MYAKKLQPGENAAYAVSRLMYEPHIYAALPDHLRDVFFAHRMLKEIESGDRMVFAVFCQSDNSFLGVVHGTMEGSEFVAHTMFRRKTNAVKAALLCQEQLEKFCRDNAIALTAIVGYPPEHIRAAVIMNRRFGCIDCGPAKDVEFLSNGRPLPCRYFRKEIK